MRFGEIYRRCKENYNYIEHCHNQVSEKYGKIRGENQVITELNSLTESIKKNLGDINILQEVTHKVNNRNLTSGARLNVIENELLAKMKLIIQLYESLDQNKQGIGLDIKVPETDNFTEFKKFIDGLEFVFTKCPFFQSNDARLKFKSVDIGSTWLIIGVACATIATGSVLLNNIATFIDKCIVIQSHKQTYMMQKQEIEKSKCDKAEKEEIIKYLEKAFKIGVDNAIKELEDATGHQIQDGDERGRVEQSFERLEKLLDKGLQIYVSIDSPPETKALFEPLEMHYLSIAEELKRIEKKSDDETKG